MKTPRRWTQVTTLRGVDGASLCAIRGRQHSLDLLSCFMQISFLWIIAFQSTETNVWIFSHWSTGVFWWDCKWSLSQEVMTKPEEDAILDFFLPRTQINYKPKKRLPYAITNLIFFNSNIFYQNVSKQCAFLVFFLLFTNNSELFISLKVR